MTYAICHLSMIPMRASASDRAEMVSQILFGEFVRVDEEKGSWLHVSCLLDDYSGWIDKKQCLEVAEDLPECADPWMGPVCQDHFAQLIAVKGEQKIDLCLGASLPGLSGKKFKLGEEKYTLDGNAGKAKKVTRQSICETARMYLGSPYLWGGRSPFGIDCSGLVQMVFRINGIKLFRDADRQSSMGVEVGFAEQAQPGDVAFFENKEGKIIHTGLVLEDQQIIHASGCVRIDKIDHEGIFNESTKKYTHKLRLIKTLL